MRSFIRVYVCTLLLRDVASLSTMMLQNNDLSIDQGFEKSKLRGSDRVEQPQHWDANVTGYSHREAEVVDDVKQHSSMSQEIRTQFETTVAKTSMSPIRILALATMVGLIVVSLLIICGPHDESEYTTSEPCSSSEFYNQKAKPREELAAMKSCDGTWSQTYQQADEQSKQGLELLFRCHIIPTNEFAHSKISQETISEHVWISHTMLREKSLEEWCEVWPEAQAAFEEKVTACFAARTDVRSSFYDSMHRSSRSPRSMQYREVQADTGSFPPTRGGGSASPPGGRNSQIPAGLQQSGKKGKDFTLKSPADRHKLMERCRELMASSDARRKPWNSTPGAPTTSEELPAQPSSASTGQVKLLDS